MFIHKMAAKSQSRMTQKVTVFAVIFSRNDFMKNFKMICQGSFSKKSLATCGALEICIVKMEVKMSWDQKSLADSGSPLTKVTSTQIVIMKIFMLLQSCIIFKRLISGKQISLNFGALKIVVDILKRFQLKKKLSFT